MRSGSFVAYANASESDELDEDEPLLELLPELLEGGTPRPRPRPSPPGPPGPP